MAARHSLVLLACTLVLALLATPSHGKAQKKSLLGSKPKAVSKSVFERDLVQDDVSYKKVLKEHTRYWEKTEERRFNNTVLAYLTPWNPEGYEITKRFRGKFSHVAPAWLQLRKTTEEGKVFMLTGMYDVDQKWIDEVRKKGSPKMVPRLMIEGNAADIISAADDDHQVAINLIVEYCSANALDGVVLEYSTSHLYSAFEDSAKRDRMIRFVSALGLNLHSTPVYLPDVASPPNMELFFVLPAPNEHPIYFTPSELAYLEPDVDGFSLVTYDFSSPDRPGPSAPIYWLRYCLQKLLPWVKPDFRKMQLQLHERPKMHDEHDGRELRSLETGNPDFVKKILLGINFYGQDFILPQGGGPLIGHSYLGLLDKYRPTYHYNFSSAEHFFEYTDVYGSKHKVFYPTLKSILLRIEEARAWGVGLAIWEIGQGLDYFFDLF